MRFLWALVFSLVLGASAAQAQNVFTADVQMCSGHPWIDIRCNGALGDGAHDDTSAINTTITAAINANVPVLFPAGTYKITTKLTWNYQGIAGNGLEVISHGATIDGRTIAAGNVLQINCSGGTTGSPVVCNHLQIQGDLYVLGNTPAYVVEIGNTDFSDRHNAARIEHLVAVNTSTNVAAGGIQANFLSDGDIWLSGTTAGGSPTVSGVALEQVQTSRIGGFASTAGASGVALLLENGASIGNSFAGFAYDSNTNTCLSITSTTAMRNSWIVPYFACATATNSAAQATQNVLMGPSFAGTNLGPTSSGMTVVGRGNLSRFSAPTTASQTLFGADDGTVFSAANATGAPTGFTAASLPLTLPSAAQVGSGWTTGFVSDQGKAVVLTAPAGSKIISRDQQLSSLTVAGAGGSSNFETAVLQSDGANFRVLHMSQRAALLNQLATSLPANWIFLPGPGYQVTSQDNGNVLSSSVTTSGLAITLPSTTTLVNGWAVSFMQDAGKKIRITTNGTSGGQIVRSPGASVTSLITSADRQILTLQYDGAGNFREISPPARNNFDVRQWGAKCDWLTNATNDTVAFQNAVNAAASSGMTGAIIEVPATGQGCFIPDGITIPNGVWLKGVTGPNWQGPVGVDPAQWLASGSWLVGNNPTSHPLITQGGNGTAVTDLGFWYTQPQPAVLPATTPPWTPTQYGWVIDVVPPAQFTRLENLHIVAATNCIRLTGPTTGIGGGIFSTFRNIHFDGCFNIGTQFNRIDNTILMDNLRYDMYWNIGSIPMLAYAEGGHKVDWDLHYLANQQASNIEFFESWRAIQLTNDTVVSGFGNITAAASALQLTNISANEVCQFIAPTDVSARGDGAISNLILARDTTSPTLCAGGTDIMMDLTSNFALWKVANARAADVQTIAALGPTSTLQMVNSTFPAYSFFGPGANAFMVSAGAELLLPGASPRDFIKSAGGGPIIGCGVDATCGWSQPISVGFPGEGSVQVKGSADTTHAGSVEFIAPDGVTRRGFVGRGTSANELNVQSDSSVQIIGGTGQLNLTSSGSATRIAVVGKLPTSCSGLATGDLWMDTSASNTVKVCP